jgi:plasmid stabilization system protein ParE
VTTRISLEPEAAAELADAARWYEDQHPGLGSEFLSAVDNAIAHLLDWPHSAPLVPGLSADLGIRSVGVRRFPYRVVYLHSNGAVRVLAVAHLRRRPGYWHTRTHTAPRTD